jgi:hypothetical protein
MNFLPPCPRVRKRSVPEMDAASDAPVAGHSA